jgi:hypothetical protein
VIENLGGELDLLAYKEQQALMGGLLENMDEDGVEELDKEVVDKIIQTKNDNLELRACDGKRKSKGQNWGPILVERQRRK